MPLLSVCAVAAANPEAPSVSLIPPLWGPHRGQKGRGSEVPRPFKRGEGPRCGAGDEGRGTFLGPIYEGPQKAKDGRPAAVSCLLSFCLVHGGVFSASRFLPFALADYHIIQGSPGRGLCLSGLGVSRPSAERFRRAALELM